MPSHESGAVPCYNTYCSTAKIETAELFAIALALSVINPQADKSVRVISDSLQALKKIQRIFHHPDQRQIQTIKDLMQKKLMYNMSCSFSKMGDIEFSFQYMHSHQRKSGETTDTYYNALADQQALIGRMNGEMIHQQEKEHRTGVSSLSAEERIILNQPDCFIVSPSQISFDYEDLKPKTIVRARNHPKDRFVRTVCKKSPRFPQR